MGIAKRCVGIALSLFIVMPQGAIAGTTLLDWEGTIDDGSPRDSLSRGWGEENMQIPEEEIFQEEEILEIAIPSKRQKSVQNFERDTDLKLMSLPENLTKGIKDETSTTGDNVKKSVPAYLKPQEVSSSSPLLYDINSLVSPVAIDIENTNR